MRLPDSKKGFHPALILLVFLVGITPSLLHAEPRTEFVVSHRSPETEGDKREDYSIALIALALEKTKAKYGSYTLNGIPPMNTARTHYALRLNIYPNLLMEMSYEEKHIADGQLTYADFPLELGITGVRVCFVNPAVKDEIKKVKNVEQLKKYIIGQGVAWADTEILRHNGFNVVEISNYESIFKMTTAGRVDLFCRGVNEIYDEYKIFKDKYNLTVDDSFVITYPLPRFYFLNSANQILKKRIEDGLRMAYQDGSLQKLWQEHYQTSLKFSNIEKRRVFKLENPLIKKLPHDYESFFYNPF